MRACTASATTCLGLGPAPAAQLHAAPMLCTFFGKAATGHKGQNPSHHNKADLRTQSQVTPTSASLAAGNARRLHAGISLLGSTGYLMAPLALQSALQQCQLLCCRSLLLSLEPPLYKPLRLVIEQSQLAQHQHQLQSPVHCGPCCCNCPVCCCCRCRCWIPGTASAERQQLAACGRRHPVHTTDTHTCFLSLSVQPFG